MKKHWYDYLWIVSLLYLLLGFVNILFAWLGMLDLFLPLIFSIFGGNKFFCNNLCGRGQLFSVLGRKLKWSRDKVPPRWLAAKGFRYGFLIFFFAMFFVMLYQTWLVAAGAASLREAVKLLWTFFIPWDWAYTVTSVPQWVTQFSYGFYGVMLTSLVIGLVVMVLYRPRTWCAFCPIGTMTQGICQCKARGKAED